MKTTKVFLTSFLTIVLLVTMSFITKDRSMDIDKIKSADIENNMNPDKEKCDCPPNWVLIDLNEWPDDPALFWDKNGDKFVCFKGVDWGGTTPKGKGNDPMWSMSNVKDNNNPLRPHE